MKRKLIKQGLGGLTFYLPKKWADEKGLKGGDEIEIDEFEENLVISSKTQKKGPKVINLNLKNTRESAIRTLIVNAYRAGFDKINLTYECKDSIIKNILIKHIIGFEIMSSSNKKCVIESVTEPSYDNFENLLQKQFYMLLEIIKNIDNFQIVEEYILRIQRYDNFLKRCISKKVFTPKAVPFLWQFLTSLTHSARACFHFSKDIVNNKLNLDKDVKKFIIRLEEMGNILKNSYLKQSIDQLYLLHELDQEIVYEKGRRILLKKSPLILYHIVYITREIYLCHSPLIGYIEMNKLNP